ncbi:hypothetical protein BJ741DRAFT_592825 [Chytriomyces cf. hyalinus JEL632]|nr:hypothetical protein BJ741DRAFT_592825 [Chytriomyces cf. hyalinus JEL632]
MVADFPLLATAMVLPLQGGVSQSIRAQLRVPPCPRANQPTTRIACLVALNASCRNISCAHSRPRPCILPLISAGAVPGFSQNS